jgi:hypothetical protein
MATDKEIIDSLKRDWLSSDFYNFEDLNRVETAINIVRERVIVFYGQLVPIDSPKLNRTVSSIEFADSLNRIEQNIFLLKLTFPNMDIFNPSKTDWKYNDPFRFTDANRLEQDLYEMYYNIENNISTIPYCGTIIAGERGVI